MDPRRILIGMSVLLCSAVALFVGCDKGGEAPTPAPVTPVSAGPKVTVALPAELTAMKTETEKGKALLDAVLASMDATVAAADGDPRPPFGKLQKDLDALKAQAATVRSRTDAMKSKGKDYFKAWETQLAGIATPAIKQAAETRKAELATNYDAILASMAKAREAYDKHVALLTDMTKVMENDLNATGLKAIAPKVADAKTAAGEVKTAVDAVLADLEKVAAIYSPGK